MSNRKVGVGRQLAVHGLTPAFWQVTFVEGEQVQTTRYWRKYDQTGAWEDQRGWLLKPDDPLIAELEAAVSVHTRPAVAAVVVQDHEHNFRTVTAGFVVCDRCGIDWGERYTRGCW